MKQNQNIETSKHIEKLAKLIKVTEAATDLVRAVQKSKDLEFRFQKEIKKLSGILELPTHITVHSRKYYYAKKDAIKDGFENSLRWFGPIKMWKVD